MSVSIFLIRFKIKLENYDIINLFSINFINKLWFIQLVKLKDQTLLLKPLLLLQIPIFLN